MNNWIVVVDDEPMSLMSVRTMLGNDDMKISCLRSGSDLLKFMDKNDPDLILMDVMMPGMDGFETYEALRENEKKMGKKETPVIFLTGDIDSSLEHQGLKLGAADYIHKSFNRDVLLRRIRNTISNYAITKLSIKPLASCIYNWETLTHCFDINQSECLSM